MKDSQASLKGVSLDTQELFHGNTKIAFHELVAEEWWLEGNGESEPIHF